MADLASTFPTNPSFQAVNFKLNTPSQTSETFSGKIRRIGFGVSYYSFEVQYPQLTPLEAGTVHGFVAQAFGPQLSFNILLPEISYSKLGSTQTVGDCFTTATISRGAKSVAIRGAAPNDWILAAGDFFRFNNHSKVYMCVSPCRADGSGNATLFFSGSVVENVPTGTGLIISAVPFNCILDSDEQEWSIVFGGMTSMSLAMREVW
jgi:hypothetical protein